MKAILAGPLAAFDVETSGVDVESDRIVTACVAQLIPDQPTWHVNTLTWLINPQIDIPAEATAIHGITTFQAKEHGQDAKEGIEQIVEAVTRQLQARIPVIGCNISFDLTMLDRECRRHDLPTLTERLGRTPSPIIDVYVIDKFLDPYRKGSRRLTELCSWYNVVIAGAHDAAFDALAATRVAFRIAQRTQLDHVALLRMYGDPEIRASYGRRHDPQEITDRFLGLSISSLDQLHEAQIGWRAEQQRLLKTYFEAEGKPSDDVREAWPIVPYLARPNDLETDGS